MFCPNCGQEKTGPETHFCSKCGFLLTGTATLLRTGGSLPETSGNPKTGSKRKRGLKQGLFIFLLTFLVVPIVAMISVWSRIGPELVSLISVALFMGGLLRMAYAWLLEEDSAAAAQPSQAQNQISGAGYNALPPQQTTPVPSYVASRPGNWRDTNDLEPASVTESTTRLLSDEERHDQ